MELAYLVLGLLIGAVSTYLITRGKGAANITLLEAERAAKAELKTECEQRLREARQEAERQRANDLAELRHSHEQQLALLKAEVTTATEKMLKERSGELQQANTQKMDELFRPIKEDISTLQKSINDSRVASAQSNTRFEDIMRQMKEAGDKMGTQAERLSTALLRKNKVAGNFGEVILTELLESQGLTPGMEFDVQSTIKDESGRALCNDETGSRMIPDVLMHLGDSRDVVIDSKMSLTAFVDYQNAGSEEERRTALARHIESVRTHVRELSGKDYSSYVTKKKSSIDFVIMFVPIEGALQLALGAEPTLWREAFDKRVFIAGSQTLVAALHIIKLTWISIQQERNTMRIMDEARKLIDRVAMFYKDFQTVGARLSDAAKAYAAVEKRVDQGSQSILSTAHRLESLGARGKKELPRPDSAGEDIGDSEGVSAKD